MGRYYAHRFGFHAARTPVYALRLWSKAPIEDVPNGRKVYPHLAKRKALRLHPAAGHLR